jgi:hypothetical protein
VNVTLIEIAPFLVGFLAGPAKESPAAGPWHKPRLHGYDGLIMGDSDAIREWAKSAGLEVADTGRIPASVRQAYDLAHADADDPGAEPGPDWAAAAAEAGGPGLAASGPPEPDPPADAPAGPSQPPGGPQGTDAGPAGESTGPPPPADLADARARLEGTRKRGRPGWAGKESGRRPRAAKPAPPKLTREIRGDIEGKLTLLLSGPVSILAAVDPVCGGAAVENLDLVVRKAVPLICQSPAAVAWFTKGTTFLLWLDLVWALQPIAVAAYSHHVAGTVMVLPDGRIVPSVRLEDGSVVPAEQAPAAPRPDYSAYTTHVPGHVPAPRPA